MRMHMLDVLLLTVIAPLLGKCTVVTMVLKQKYEEGVDMGGVLPP